MRQRELLLLSRRGGCGKKNNREASTVPQTEWWFNKFLSNLDHHPVCAFAFGYRRIHPSWPGGAIRAYQQLVHTFIDRTYSCDRHVQRSFLLLRRRACFNHLHSCRRCRLSITICTIYTNNLYYYAGMRVGESTFSNLCLVASSQHRRRDQG